MLEGSNNDYSSEEKWKLQKKRNMNTANQIPNTTNANKFINKSKTKIALKKNFFFKESI